MAGAMFKPERCDPHTIEPGIAAGEGGHGSWVEENASTQSASAAGALETRS